MSKRIRSITLESFKGATNPVTIDFDPSKPTVLIFGENGTGKSTIVDGIDFVCNEEYGSIDDRSVSGSKADLLASLGDNIANLKITLDYAGDTWSGTIGHGKRPSSSGGTGDKPKAKILRRNEILQIVDGQPKERYEALRSFIEVPSTENNEKTLREAIRTIEDKLNEAVRSSGQADTHLKDLWVAEGMPGEDYTKWGMSTSAADVSSLKATAEHLGTIISKMGNCLSAYDSLLQAKSSATESEDSFKKAHEAFEAIEEGIKGYEKDIIDVLQEAKKFISKYPAIDSCPVCEKTNTSDELLKKLDDRLNKMGDIIKAKSSLESAKKNFESKKQIQTTREKDWVDRVKELAIISRDSSIPEIASLEINWDSFAPFFNEIENSEVRLKLATQLYNQLLSCKGSLEEGKRRLDKEINQHNAIRTYYETIQKKEKQAVKFQGQLKKLKQLHELMEKERKAYVENELSSISGEVDSLYVKVHPNEGLGKVKFSLDPKFIGSMEFTGEFQGRPDIQPQAYYSESHLDTLGICVFLALAKKYSDENAIVVLDDVITSIDQAHMTRFMQMLHDEAASFNQMIITTHYRPWKDRYKYSGGPSGEVQLIELLHWSHPRGIRHTKAKLSVEELNEYLEEEKYDRQVVSSKAGILLEGLIDHIALCYGCRLPRKAVPDYTLGELVDSINKKLKGSLRIQKAQEDGKAAEITLESLLDEIASLTWIRNKVGCHFNVSGMDISDTDVKHFGALTVGLANVLICANCGELPHRNQSGSFWQCKCGKNIMHPLMMPT